MQTHTKNAKKDQNESPTDLLQIYFVRHGCFSAIVRRWREWSISKQDETKTKKIRKHSAHPVHLFSGDLCGTPRALNFYTRNNSNNINKKLILHTQTVSNNLWTKRFLLYAKQCELNGNLFTDLVQLTDIVVTYVKRNRCDTTIKNNDTEEKIGIGFFWWK